MFSENVQIFEYRYIAFGSNFVIIRGVVFCPKLNAYYYNIIQVPVLHLITKIILEILFGIKVLFRSTPAIPSYSIFKNRKNCAKRAFKNVYLKKECRYT